MAQLSDNIEQFIKELMCEDTRVELKRNELAQHFGWRAFTDQLRAGDALFGRSRLYH